MARGEGRWAAQVPRKMLSDFVAPPRSATSSPAELNSDFGEPAGVCAEAPPGSGTFVRDFARATVEMDCATWTPSIVWKRQ